MRRTILKNVSLYTRTLISSSQNPNFNINKSNPFLIPRFNFPNSFNFISSHSISNNPKDDDFVVDDVSTEELKNRIKKYFDGDEDALPSILEAILARRLTGLHPDTDDELAEQLKFTTLDNKDDRELEADSEEACPTDGNVPDLYRSKGIVIKGMMKDENFNVDEKKWLVMIEEADQKGQIGVSKKCEEILEEMLRWDNVLPEDLKKTLQEKRRQIAKRVDNKEIEEEEGKELFNAFEDEIIVEYGKKGQVESSVESAEVAKPDKRSDDPPDNMSDDPPGVGPILRWQTRLVLTHGGDAWHPKNRKVKLSVTVKELGLSKYQFRRMREIVGKRYHSGKDELTITSERFDHRLENQKDCLRTLLNIIREAGEADALIQKARTAYVKERLQANPAFMARLHAKTKQAPDANTA